MTGPESASASTFTRAALITIVATTAMFVAVVAAGAGGPVLDFPAGRLVH